MMRKFVEKLFSNLWYQFGAMCIIFFSTLAYFKVGIFLFILWAFLWMFRKYEN